MSLIYKDFNRNPNAWVQAGWPTVGSTVCFYCRVCIYSRPVFEKPRESSPSQSHRPHRRRNFPENDQVHGARFV